MKRSITLKNFTNWVNSLPPNSTFQFSDISNCVFASFLKSLGYKTPCVGGYTWDKDENTNQNYPIPEPIRQIIHHVIFATGENIITKQHLLDAIKNVS